MKPSARPKFRSINNENPYSKFIQLDLEYKFSVTDDEKKHSIKRDCKLYGANLLITDPEHTEPPICMFLPQWIYNCKQGQHYTLTFTSDIPHFSKIVKLKTRDADISQKWNERIQTICNDLSFFQVRQATHGIRLLHEGKFIKARMSVSPDRITFSDNKILGDYKRDNNLMAVPDYNDPKRVLLFYNSRIIQTIRLNKEDQTFTVLIDLNSTCDIETTKVPEIVIEPQDIPDISDRISFGGTGASTSFFKSNRGSGNFRGSHLSLSPETILAPDTLIDLDQSMNDRLKKIIANYGEQDRIPSVNELFNNFCENVKIRHPNGNSQIPDVIYPVDTSDAPLFKMNHSSPQLERFYSKELVVPSPETFTIKNVPKSDKFAIALDHVASNTSIDFDVKSPNSTKYDELLKLINSIPNSQQYLIAAGIFLQGRNKLDSAGFQLQQHTFHVKELNDFIRNHPFRSDTCLSFFSDLAYKRMLSLFFRALYSWNGFRLLYGNDSFLSCDSVYCRLAELYEQSVPLIMEDSGFINNSSSSKKIKQADNEEKIIALFSENYLPEITLSITVKTILSNIPEYFLDSTTKVIIEAFAKIFSSLVLICTTNYNQNGRAKMTTVWNKFSIFRKLNPDIEAKIRKSKRTEEKLISLFIILLQQKKLSQWVIGILIKENTDNAKRVSAILGLGEIVKLSDLFKYTKYELISDEFLQDVTKQVINLLGGGK